MSLLHSPTSVADQIQPNIATGQAARRLFQDPPEIVPQVAATSTTIQKLPTFWSEQPQLWFIQVESVFQLSRVSGDETKYAHILANLEPSYLKFVGDILLSPPRENKYEALKKRLIETFSISEEAKLKKLFSGLVMGDQKPSHFLQTMKALAVGNDVGDNVLKTVFLGQLPDNIRSILATTQLNLTDLALQADKIMEITHPQISSVGLFGNKVDHLYTQIGALEKKIDAFMRGRSEERNFKRREDRQ